MLGYPVHLMENLPAKAANSYSIGFGDWQRAYLIVDRVNLTMLRDPFSSRPSIAFYARKRVGGCVLNSAAFKVAKFAAT